MTTDERIDKIEEQVSKFKDDVWKKLESIDDKLTTLTINMAKQPQCPSPGKCLQLDTALGSSVLRIERLELRLMAIERWRAWVTGIGVASGTLIGLLFQYVMKHL